MQLRKKDQHKFHYMRHGNLMYVIQNRILNDKKNNDITKFRYPYTFKKSLFVILYELLVLNCNNETNVKNVSISPNVMFDFCTEIS